MHNEIGDRIKAFIKLCYGSQKLFAQITNLSQAHLNAYVVGSRTPGSDILIRFNDAGMSIDWLLTGNGEMFADNEAGRELRSKYEQESNENPANPESKIRMITEEELQRLAELAAKSTIEQLSIKAAATSKKKEE